MNFDFSGRLRAGLERGRAMFNSSERDLNRAHKHMLDLADAYSMEDAAVAAVYETGISLEEARQIGRDLVKRGYEFTNVAPEKVGQPLKDDSGLERGSAMFKNYADDEILPWKTEVKNGRGEEIYAEAIRWTISHWKSISSRGDGIRKLRDHFEITAAEAEGILDDDQVVDAVGERLNSDAPSAFCSKCDCEKNDHDTNGKCTKCDCLGDRENAAPKTEAELVEEIKRAKDKLFPGDPKGSHLRSELEMLQDELKALRSEKKNSADPEAQAREDWNNNPEEENQSTLMFHGLDEKLSLKEWDQLPNIAKSKILDWGKRHGVYNSTDQRRDLALIAEQEAAVSKLRAWLASHDEEELTQEHATKVSDLNNQELVLAGLRKGLANSGDPESGCHECHYSYEDGDMTKKCPECGATRSLDNSTYKCGSCDFSTSDNATACRHEDRTGHSVYPRPTCGRGRVIGVLGLRPCHLPAGHTGSCEHAPAPEGEPAGGAAPSGSCGAPAGGGAAGGGAGGAGGAGGGGAANASDDADLHATFDNSKGVARGRSKYGTQEGGK